MPDIRHYIEIDAPPERVFEAVSTAAGARRWWTPHVDGDDQVGGHLHFGFDSGGEAEAIVREREPQRVRWELTRGPDSPANAEWEGTSLVFEIEPARDGAAAVLRFGHDGWRDASDTFAGCNFIWGFFMRSIKSLVETGRGTPR